MISCFSNRTSLICLFQPWRQQAFSILASPEKSRRLRVGLPTPVKSEKTHRVTLTWCSLPSTNSSHPRATSHCLNNRISSAAHRRSQPLHWTSHRTDRFSTSLLETTRSRLLRMPWVSTSLLGTMRHHSQETILTLTSSINSQLTHLISRDDAAQGQDAPNVPDAPMPDAPTVHDIATPRRMIGGGCRKWCISAQPTSGKRKCAACSLCGTRFTHGEARLQQWGNRQTNHHYVHAHCVNGGLGHGHELFPKQATDQDAVNAVTPQRDIITRTAADTEVLLPFAQDPDQASTAAPPDDEQDMFGREEALRMDEEIMDFQWFEHVTWDSLPFHILCGCP